MEEDRDTMQTGTQDRRFWTRVAAAESAITVRSDTMNQPARIVNKSFGGISVCVKDVSELKPGSLATIECEGAQMQAKVKRIEGGSNDQYRVAFEWLLQANAFEKILANLVEKHG